jgi:23S rRNA pseudouridine1911/1915/1917 synthase
VTLAVAETVVGEVPPGTRVVDYAKAHLVVCPVGAVGPLVASGAVELGGRRARIDDPVRPGDRLAVARAALAEVALAPEAVPLAIAYEDADLLVVDKPAGMHVHPLGPYRTGTLVNALLHHVRDWKGVGGVERPGIVHRLDRDTSGVLLVAKTDRAHASLSRQMKKRSMRKEYLALAAGIPRVRKGEVALPIGRDPRDRKRMKAFRAEPEPPSGTREARTLYEIERDWFELGLTLLRCRLVTGRTHQIRVHLAAANLPVVGDPVYGRPRYERVKDAALKKRLLEFPRQALHAERVGFRHPATNEPIEIAAPLPADFAELLAAIDGASR